MCCCCCTAVCCVNQVSVRADKKTHSCFARALVAVFRHVFWHSLFVHNSSMSPCYSKSCMSQAWNFLHSARAQNSPMSPCRCCVLYSACEVNTMSRCRVGSNFPDGGSCVEHEHKSAYEPLLTLKALLASCGVFVQRYCSKMRFRMGSLCRSVLQRAHESIVT